MYTEDQMQNYDPKQHPVHHSRCHVVFCTYSKLKVKIKV